MLLLEDYTASAENVIILTSSGEISFTGQENNVLEMSFYLCLDDEQWTVQMMNDKRHLEVRDDEFVDAPVFV